jgi:sugar lactone lactonase YvrE
VAAAFGVAFDGTRGALWVTTAGTPHMKDFQPGDTARAELLRVRLRDGRIEQRWLLGDGKGMPGELSLTPSGDVLVSDGLRARLYRLRQGAGTMEVITSPVVRSPQGIAPSADGSVAWVADWSHGLLRWDLRTDSVTAVTTPDDIALLGVDGLRRHGDRLIGVQNGVTPARVVAITLDAGGRAVRAVETIDRPAAMEGEPTVGAIAGDRYVYVSSGGWPFFGDDGSRLPRTPALPPVTVRELTLRR